MSLILLMDPLNIGLAVSNTEPEINPVSLSGFYNCCNNIFYYFSSWRKK